MFQDLGKLDPRLDGIIAIRGVGLSSNVYVVKGDDITLIDSGVGDEYNRLDTELERLQSPVRNVQQAILTHTHLDHFGGLLTIQRLSSPRIMVHKLDSDELVGLDPALVDCVEEGETITASTRKLKVIHTPGHTAGSICLFDESNKILFSGDTVFPNGLFGRTDLPTGDSLDLVNSLRKLSGLSVESLLPGHESAVIHDGSSHIRMSYEVAKSFFESQ